VRARSGTLGARPSGRDEAREVLSDTLLDRCESTDVGKRVKTRLSNWIRGLTDAYAVIVGRPVEAGRRVAVPRQRRHEEESVVEAYLLEVRRQDAPGPRESRREPTWVEPAEAIRLLAAGGWEPA
jgi:hypothetical protein